MIQEIINKIAEILSGQGGNAPTCPLFIHLYIFHKNLLLFLLRHALMIWFKQHKNTKSMTSGAYKVDFQNLVMDQRLDHYYQLSFPNFSCLSLLIKIKNPKGGQHF